MITVILVGHGSARHPEAAQPIRDLAAALAAAQGWDCRAVFMKQSPSLDHALDGAQGEVVVVPVFAGKGYYTDSLIPTALGLEGTVTRRDGRVLRYTPPVGTHPRIPGLIACRAAGVALDGGTEFTDCGLLLIAHGSARPGGAGDTPRAIAQAIRDMECFAEVSLTFLEQEPFASDWPALVTRHDQVVLPLLVAQGMHASRDIPPLFGLTAGQTGPAVSHGHRVWLASGLGAEPELVDIVAEMVGTALRP